MMYFPVATLILTLFTIGCTEGQVKDGKYRDCQDVREAGFTKSGVYTLYMNDTRKVEALCDHAVDKSYTIIQQRITGDVNFYRGYKDYQNGFGSTTGDFWIGLDMIHYLTSPSHGQGNIVLDVQLQDWNGNNRAANYKYFYVDDHTTRYKLSISGFSGNVPDDLSYSNGMQFGTFDAPDYYKCAVNQKGGWWYNYCSYALPTGLYYSGGHYTPTSGFYDGIYWRDWLGYGYSLRFIRLMVSRVV